MTRANKQIRLVHTSDLHLGEKHSGKTDPPEDSASEVLTRVVNTAGELKADLLLIAGDLFDSSRVHTDVIKEAAGELARAGIPVVILPGNHDCLVPDSAYNRVDFPKLAPNVHVITEKDGEKVSFPKLGVAAWGRGVDSYDDGHFRPLAGIPPRGAERWQIALAHGHYVGDNFDQIYSYKIGREEIASSDYDYIALGHWGLFRVVCNTPVKAVYSGSAPLTGKLAFVDLSADGEVSVEPRPLRP